MDHGVRIESAAGGRDSFRGRFEDWPAVRHLRNEYGEVLTTDTRTEISAVAEPLESVADIRQFFRSVAVKQDVAILSRQLIHSGLLALLVSVSLTLEYRTVSVGPYVPRGRQ